MLFHFPPFFYSLTARYLAFQAFFWAVMEMKIYVAPETNDYICNYSIRISFIRISRLKFAKFQEYFKNKAEAEILKRIDIILCVETSVNTIQFYVFNLTV